MHYSFSGKSNIFLPTNVLPRYAALNLAAFHSRLGHTEEALSAIREATTMAQEASDHTCLQHVLSLLYRTVYSDQKQRLMERCIGKCGELSLSYLASLFS